MNSQSIGTGAGRVTEGTLSLRPNANASAEDPEQFQLNSSNDNEIRQRNSQAGVESNVTKSDFKVNESVEGYEEPIMLTESTHSFLFTEPTCSAPFASALFFLALSYTCLILALLNNLIDDFSPENIFNVPVNVSLDVKIAQYLALLIGLIMEEEIPESLYLLRMISAKTLHSKLPNTKFDRFIFCALLRMLMGYIFYLNMFVVVAQSTGVIGIFFDVLALQFLQQIDDIAFRLAKMDIFGKRMKRASTRSCFRAEFEKMPYLRRKKMSIFVKVLYIINFSALMAGMTVITYKQSKGKYQCKSITVTFGDDIWENAVVLNSAGEVEDNDMDLIYSYFNGVYEKIGTQYGRPVYVEQNKFDSSPYEVKTGAVVKYCKSERAWVFMHPNIRKDVNKKNSECPWLLRSPKTDDFNLLEVSGDWSIWTGTINNGATLQTSCNACDSDAECNYHGQCTDAKCVCENSNEDGRFLYTGTHCEFPRSCAQLKGDEGDIWNIRLMDNNPWRAYGRGVYSYGWGGNITKPGPDETLSLLYSGSRWFGAVFETTDMSLEFRSQYTRELHAFWDRVYTENTRVVSNPTSRADPIAVDFFRIGRRGEKYGPLGELTPIQDPPGSGYFECAQNSSFLI